MNETNSSNTKSKVARGDETASGGQPKASNMRKLVRNKWFQNTVNFSAMINIQMTFCVCVGLE